MNPERALIYAVMAEPESLRDLEVSPEYFADAACGAIWGAISHLWVSGRQVSPLAVSEALGARHGASSLELVSKVIEDASPYAQPHHAGDYARAVKIAWRRSCYSSLLRQLADAADKGGDPEAEIARAFSLLGEMAKGQAVKGWTVAQLVDEYLRILQDRRKNPESQHQVATGLKGIDAILPGGGLAEGVLHFVAGATGMGKSSLVQTIAHKSGETGRTVDFYSFEDDPLACTTRLISRVSGINNAALQGFVTSREDDRKLAESCERLAKAKINFYETERQIEVAAVDMVNNATRNETKLIVVDYIQKLCSRYRNESRNHELGFIASELFTVARRTGAAVLVASQLRRPTNGENKRPALSDLRDSGELEQHAHTVMLIWRDKAREAGISEVNVAKQKHGPTSNVLLGFDAPTSTFRDADPLAAARYQRNS